jgi:hypothetical protein
LEWNMLSDKDLISGILRDLPVECLCCYTMISNTIELPVICNRISPLNLLYIILSEIICHNKYEDAHQDMR